ncbi:uncharacterized protein LOC132758775 isoform X2 [Ruditapes philippinarum]|uniref:uncharacterized protein LOC132758775 isoform X2 n=1 Tax=Ruditapes philippinarum TaxID=129788 RepID=UPI00295B56BF|nr:uncharacterized protein LOC132758775 isoform X2 [Ruditapes philippinarum]
MSSRKTSCEVPVQDFARIQLMFLPNALSNGKLFTDYTFPPDKSSLTYVYSGDDRYEKMVFKRPKEICSYAVFAGVGGAYETPFPWKSWKKTTWFEAAIAVVSLNVKLMDKLIPGYRNFDQSLQTDYIGCFCFKLWRFGEWIDIVVDDHLPTMDNTLLYCQAYGTPREFWGPLVEKAYAKCKKTYEANECGRTLDAFTDLTGGVCEFYTPDINPPQNLFHLLYKSCVNRSQIVCWRNDKLLTPTGFWFENEMTDAAGSGQRYLHIVTATTKFPLSDGRMVEMVRLLCLYRNEPLWNGKFADTDEISWGTVNMEFFSKYKPLGNKDENEYWMTLEDFRCNFGGLIICSTEIPYTTEGLNLQRCYRRLSEDEIKTGQRSLFTQPKERRRSSDSKHRRQPSATYLSIHRRSHPCLSIKTFNDQADDIHSPNDNQPEMEILVRENPRTVKVDNTQFNRASKIKKLKQKSKSENAKIMSKKNSYGTRRESTGAVYRKRDPSPVSCFKRLHHYDDVKSDAVDTKDSDLNDESKDSSKQCTSTATNDKKTPVKKQSSSGYNTHNAEYCQKRSDSLISTCSALSECQSTFSASDITLNIGTSRENSLQRPKSAPSNIIRNTSSGSLPNMIINNFVASSSDNFRSHGSWRFVINYKGKWEKCDSMGSYPDLIKQHSRNSRIPFNILHPDAVNEIVAPGYHGKSHLIISLLQDYRHGAPTANSLLVPIGFSIYKTKNPAKDEKRSLSKLPMVGEATLCEDSREYIILERKQRRRMSGAFQINI